MFVVRFVRANNEHAGVDWSKKLTFVVKSIDRPSITPTVETINQYNKKRVVTTGYTVAPLRLVLYDTADNLVHQMWDEYTRWYYGDFNQTEAGWNYDVTTAGYSGEQAAGFGYQPRPGNDEMGQSSQFFFKKVEVYQVFGGEYTQFDLLHPKITQFDPDELDYSQSELASISMQLAYEAILYRNEGNPDRISNDPWLSAIFDEEFNGDAFEVPNAPTRGASTGGYQADFGDPSFGFEGFGIGGGLPNFFESNPTGGIGGGALSMFGNFDFGGLRMATATAAAAGGAARRLVGDVSYLANGNPSLSTALSIGRNVIDGSRSTGALLSSAVDNVSGVLTGSAKNSYGRDYLRSNVVGGVLASAQLSGTTAKDQVQKDDGLGLNSETYGIMNAKRPSYSQVGVNTAAYTKTIFTDTPTWDAPQEGDQWDSDDYFSDGTDI